MTQRPSNAVTIRDLEVRIHSGDRPYTEALPILRGLNLAVPTGQVTALVGANGAGKTTTLRTVTGALAFTTGTIEVLGTALGPARVHPPQGAASMPDISAHPRRWTPQHVARLRRRVVPGFDSSRFEELLTTFGVPHQRELRRLSRGQATQLGLAAALAQDPQLLILDEPFAHLDPLARMELIEVLRDFMAEKERTLLLATHDLDGMERFVDQLVVIAQGRDVLSGEVESLREEFLLCELDRTDAEAGPGQPFIGPTTTGTRTRALVAVDDAVGLPTSASLRRPDVSEIVTHVLRAARTDAPTLRRTHR
ncbi:MULTISPECIES: ATP-binding cassette domain-containing protein [unclassified Brachybacterium]|uniref:ATP-binding cassette domain-containing protein n=1 Tax=unclassified Brachybacterium TaxID=2623841 RepID=UPI003F92850B